MDLTKNYFVQFNVKPATEPYKEYEFPWTPALEGKTIVGVETYVEAAGATSLRVGFGIAKFVASLYSFIVKDDNKNTIVELPYYALARTGLYAQNLPPAPGVQPRQLKPRFSFVFSSKNTFLQNNSTSPFPVQNATVYFCFKYLP